jgi:hypothetical protein
MISTDHRLGQFASILTPLRRLSLLAGRSQASLSRYRGHLGWEEPVVQPATRKHIVTGFVVCRQRSKQVMRSMSRKAFLQVGAGAASGVILLSQVLPAPNLAHPKKGWDLSARYQPGNTCALQRCGLLGGVASVIAIPFTSFPCPGDSRIGRSGNLPSPSASASALKVRLCERSLTRELGSVTLGNR